MILIYINLAFKAKENALISEINFRNRNFQFVNFPFIFFEKDSQQLFGVISLYLYVKHI
jgi:hypothetical protein